MMGRKHFVLVHGANHGAWCWFKTIDMLEKAGHKATALDLVSAGISPVNADDVHSFDQYSKPLYDLLESLGESEKVILVGHSLGGLTVARASERYADKIAGAVYVTALMFASGQSTTPSEVLIQNKYMRFRYGNGSDKPPTSWKFRPEILKELLYNTSSSETSQLQKNKWFGGLYLEEQEFQLAMLLAKPTPLVDDNTSFTQDGYYSVPRVYIRTLQDGILPLQIQDTFIANNPPQQVRTLDCDHSPFFSAAKELHQLLLDFAATNTS